MKRLAIMLCVAASVVCTNAKILRVSNVNGSTAPYSSIEDAQTNAVDGDTILIDGSSTKYSDKGITISKRVVLIGPGYMLIENGIVEEGAVSASLGTITIEASGVHVYGLTLDKVEIGASDVVIARCITGRINLNTSSRCIIHQNHITGFLFGDDEYSVYGTTASYASITNNIFYCESSNYNLNVAGFIDSTIKYNTWIHKLRHPNYKILGYLENCTVENNILPRAYDSTDTNYGGSNYVFDETPFTNKETEVDIKNTELSFSQGKYGAFSGDDPYVISGIPAGAIIQDVTIPASVEQDKNLKVTVKLGIQQ